MPRGGLPVTAMGPQDAGNPRAAARAGDSPPSPALRPRRRRVGAGAPERDRAHRPTSSNWPRFANWTLTPERKAAPERVRRRGLLPATSKANPSFGVRVLAAALGVAGGHHGVRHQASVGAHGLLDRHGDLGIVLEVLLGVLAALAD